MHPLDATLWRVENFQAQVEALAEGEFPYAAPKDALRRLEKVFASHKERLCALKATEDPNLIQRICSQAVLAIVTCMPFLGLMLRATNVRNAFETFAPLQRLAKTLLGSSTLLVLSSEWEYSPLTYTRIDDLPDFVLIGLPATESDNPLIIPVAGHELGHSLWDSRRVDNAVTPGIKRALTKEVTDHWSQYERLFPPNTEKEELWNDLFSVDVVQLIYNWSLRQCEETFCDLIGLRTFGRSYLEAFSFLAAPRMHQSRMPTYPATRDRIAHLLKGAKQFGINIPNGYEQRFELDDKPSKSAPGLQLSLADKATAGVIDDLIMRASDLARELDVPTPRWMDLTAEVRRLQQHVPIERADSLQSIINAAWKSVTDGPSDLIQWNSDSSDARKTFTDLVLKSIEIHEIELKQSSYQAGTARAN